MYEWSSILGVDSSLKRAVDNVICSLCCIQPQFFTQLLEWMGVHGVDLPITDDHKEEMDSGVGGTSSSTVTEMLTDDTKEAAARSASVSSAGRDHSFLVVDETRLMTVAVACQSPDSLQRLLDSGLVAVLCQGLFEFCTHQILCYSESLQTPPYPANTSSAAAGASGGKSPNSPRRPEDRPRNVSESSSVTNG